MRRIAALCLLALLAPAAPAQALLVYQRIGSNRLVAASNDGRHAHAIGRPGGRVVETAVSPNGRWIVYVVSRGGDGPGAGLAYLVDAAGRHRHLLAADSVQTFASYPSIAWSPTSRYVALGPDADLDVLVIDVVTGRQRAIPMPDVSAGASFSPDGRYLAFAWAGGSQGPLMDAIRLGSGDNVPTPAGDLPLWGRRGLAFDDDQGLELATGIRHGNVYVQPLGSAATPVGWSADGRRLLAAVSVRGPRDSVGAILITLPQATATGVPQIFRELDGISRDGRHVLGVVGHSVVDVGTGGRARTLAAGARAASWNR